MTYRTDPGSYGLGRHLAREEEAIYWSEHHCIACARCEEKYEAVRELRNFIGRKSEAGLPATGLYKLEDEAENVLETIDEGYRQFPFSGQPPHDRIYDLRQYMTDILEWMQSNLPESSCDNHADCGQH